MPEPVLVQQGLVPEQLEQALEALLELLEQALEALLGLVPLLAFLREQVVPVQGGLRVVGVLATLAVVWLVSRAARRALQDVETSL